MELQTFSTLVSLLVLAITWLIVQPLKAQIAALQASIDKLTSAISMTNTDVTALKVSTSKNETAIQRIDHEIADLKRRVQ